MKNLFTLLLLALSLTSYSQFDEYGRYSYDGSEHKGLLFKSQQSLAKGTYSESLSIGLGIGYSVKTHDGLHWSILFLASPTFGNMQTEQFETVGINTPLLRIDLEMDIRVYPDLYLGWHITNPHRSLAFVMGSKSDSYKELGLRAYIRPHEGSMSVGIQADLKTNGSTLGAFISFDLIQQ